MSKRKRSRRRGGGAAGGGSAYEPGEVGVGGAAERGNSVPPAPQGARLATPPSAAVEDGPAPLEERLVLWFAVIVLVTIIFLPASWLLRASLWWNGLPSP